MNTLDRLYSLASKHDINIYFFDLKEIGVLGLNIEEKNMQHMIFLDSTIKQDKKIHIEVLAHELGHYFTTVGNYISKPVIYSDALKNCKCENKANYWAYNYLIPENKLVKIINKNITKIDELAEYLEVRIEFLIKRLEYLALRKQMLHLANNKYLILTNLPNLYVYEKVGGHDE